MNTPFKPLIIGQPDAEITKQVTNLFELICSEAGTLKCNLEMLFAEKEEEIVTTEFILKLLNSDPENVIRTTWVSYKEINLPGIDMKKFIASDLLEIPKYDEIIESVVSLKQFLTEAKLFKFNFPMAMLVNEDGYYSLNEEFHNQLHEYGAFYTESEQQNQVLEAVTELKDAINKICNLRLIPVNNLSNLAFKFDRHVLKRNNQKENPFELNPRMFHTTLRNLPKV